MICIQSFHEWGQRISLTLWGSFICSDLLIFKATVVMQHLQYLWKDLMLRPCLSLGEVHLKSVQCAGATTVICCQQFAFAHNSGKQHSAALQVWRLWTKSCIFASHFQESKIHLQLRLSSVALNPFKMFSFFWRFK
jgi:hypothetical protein